VRRSVVICEGSTDFALLQYYLRKALSWEDAPRGRQGETIRFQRQRSRLLVRDGGELTLVAAGGAGNIHKVLELVLTRMRQGGPDGSDAYDNVVVVTDRDDDDTEKMMLGRLSATLDEGGARGEFALACGEWSQYVVKTRLGLEVPFRMNVLFVPTEGNGAMETFLLDAVGRRDPYDGAIVARCKDFVDGADPERRYLTKRGYVTKAVFDAFFSVRTTVDQFAERQRVLLSVDWENYAAVNEGFSVLAEL
jgi:hypothetical protein